MKQSAKSSKKSPPSPASSHTAAEIELTSEFLAEITNPQTANNYRYALGKLAEFIADTRYTGVRTDGQQPSASRDARVRVDRLRDDLLLKFEQWLQKLNYKPRTRNVYMAAVKRFLTWLDANDHLQAGFQFGKMINRLKASRGKQRNGMSVAAREPDPGIPRIVTYYDELSLPPAAEPDKQRKRLEILRARAIVHTLYASAGRVSEVASLTREMVLDGRAKEVRITGKGDKVRLLLLTKEAQAAIAAYCHERQDEFPGLFISQGRGAGKPLGRWTLWTVVKEAAVALDLYKGTSPHAFRHYRAQQLLDEGMELTVLQAYLGHADIGTTRKIYAPHTDLGKVRSQLTKFGKSAKEAASE
jgi:site-specific recombinase XerD